MDCNSVPFIVGVKENKGNFFVLGINLVFYLGYKNYFGRLIGKNLVLFNEIRK